MKLKESFVIIFQTLTTLGLGINGILSLIMINVPGGDELVAEFLNLSEAPELQIMLMSIICLFGTIGLTFANVQSLKWKEDPDES